MDLENDNSMLIDGKAIAGQIRQAIQNEIATISGPKPCLAAVLVGDDPASHIYVRNKIRACEEVGMRSLKALLPASTSQEALVAHIEQLNQDPQVDGILVQLPLPSPINPVTIASLIHPAKDVDAVNPVNLGKLLIGDASGFIPCTPLGVQKLLTHSGISITGRHIVIAGRSNIVGKPLAVLLMQKAQASNATVTVVHSLSEDLACLTRQADILIAAIGSPFFFKSDMIKEGAVVIDVGQNRIADPSRKDGYRLVGDVDFDRVKNKCSMITPVPGGVGPMTIAMLLSNTLVASRRRRIR